MRVAIVPTGTANTASVSAAFRRLGADPTFATDAAAVRTAEHVVLPGVGSFGSAMTEIDRHGLRDALVERVEAGRPTLAVCVGMQLLATASEESPHVDGLSIIDQEVRRFPGTVLVPQLGWNRVTLAATESRFLNDGWAYFANSFRMLETPAGWRAAMTDHGGNFVAAVERGNVLACQFHPELSGSWGSAVLARWLGRAE
jgi:imidazole glycerol phosphate synthase glutamine amidotransferase subunit